MFEFFNFARKRRLSYEQLQTMQMVAQQVVLSLGGSVKLRGADKKALALKMVGELLQELSIVAPDSLISTAIEAAVKLLKALDAQTLSPETQLPSSRKLDVSGRPATGNSETGLSL